jgi:NAD(P)-dependent dehydrogenase (short-subunit alcohol dehydrogenase family)
MIETEEMRMKRMQDKIVVITGGSGGIGKTTAARFLEEGASVALVDIDQASLDATRDALGGGQRVLAIKADVSDEADVKRYVQTTIDRFGRIDVFFNNAGIEGKVAPLEQQDTAMFDKVLAINVRGAWLGLKHVLPHMYKAGAGSVINTSSISGLQGTVDVLPYVTSKHAVTGMTKVAALEAAKHNVRVNSVHPSPVNTRMMRSLEAGFAPDDAEGAKAALQKAIPLGRYGETDDIANLVLFLASDESRFITGAQYRIDGGMGAL